MALSPTPTVLGFLRETDAYTCRLPTSVNAAHPQYTSVVTYEGARQIYYVDTSDALDPGTDTTLTFQYQTVVGGITVSVYREADPPPMLIAFWRMANGYIITFMEESEPGVPGPGRAGLDAVIANLTASVSNGVPRISLRNPVLPGDLKDPMLRDVTSFYPNTWYAYPLAWPCVRFEHGGEVLATEGVDPDEIVLDVQTQDSSSAAEEAVEVRVPTAYGIKVVVQGPPLNAVDVQGLAREIAQSLRPLTQASYVGDFDLSIAFGGGGGGINGGYGSGTCSGGGTGVCAVARPSATGTAQTVNMTYEVVGQWSVPERCGLLEIDGTLTAEGPNGTPNFETSFRLIGRLGAKVSEISLGGQPFLKQAITLLKDVHGRPDGFGSCEEFGGMRVICNYTLPGALTA